MPNKSSVMRPRGVRWANVHASYQLFQARRRLSRADLARLTGLTRGTAAEIVDTLARVGLVQPVGFARQPAAGRPAEVLEFNPMARLIVGVEIGDARTIAVVADLDGGIQRRLIGEGSPNPTHALQLAEALIKDLLRGEDRAAVVGVGAGVPGVVDQDSGVIEVAPDLGWRAVPVGPTLERAFGLPVLVTNRAKAAALAEYWSGAGQGRARLVFIAISSGIAAGIVLDGHLYRGATLHEGELGHVTVLPDGPPCACSNRGCLQALAAVPALLRTAQHNDGIVARTHREALEAIARAADEGDELAVAALDTAALYLGLATANMVNLLNPEMVVFGGLLPRAIPRIVDRIRSHVRSRALAAELSGLEIVASSLGEESVALGAATLLLGDNALVERLTS
jgi:predicted NBD/HSP70 family sugar kinase